MFIKRTAKKAGLSPGTLVYLGEKKDEKVKIQIIDFSENELVEKEVATIDECLQFKKKESITWINITGIHDMQLVAGLGEKFGLHPLMLEDVVNTEQRPKLEDYGDYLFIVLKMLYKENEHQQIQHEQVSLILSPGLVISLQEYEEDVFGPLRERIRQAKGRVRSRGADYLMYALIDLVVDHYFHLFEDFGEEIELLQDTVISDPQPETLHHIQRLKREMIFLRKSVWPLRELISAMVRGEYSQIGQETILYLRDVYDHTIQVIDTVETYRDMLTGMMDIYLSSVSNRMNEVMKVLTIIATIFIPMTFLAGIYGMNFKFMPELEIKWAYPVFWLVIVAIFTSMVIWFKTRKWL